MSARAGGGAGAGFVGVWNVTIATPIGKQQVVFRIVADAAARALRGRAESPSEAVDFHDVELADAGTRLRWTQQVTKPLRLTLRFDITLGEGGATLSGTAKAGLLPSSKLVGTRVAE